MPILQVAKLRKTGSVMVISYPQACRKMRLNLHAGTPKKLALSIDHTACKQISKQGWVKSEKHLKRVPASLKRMPILNCSLKKNVLISFLIHILTAVLQDIPYEHITHVSVSC